MATDAQVKSASNRQAYHLANIEAEVSKRAQVRRAAEWLVAETRRLDGDDLDTAIEEIKRVARVMNERSRS